MAAPKGSNFEKDLAKLEDIVSALEEGGLPLDDSLKQFEAGIKLARKCEKALTEAEKKIEILTRSAAGELEAQPFEEQSGQAVQSAPKAAPAAAAPKVAPPTAPPTRDPYDDLPPDEELF